MCLYIFSKEDIKLINEYLKRGLNPDAPGFYLQWLYKKKNVYGYVLPGGWFDIGDIESYEKATNYFKEKSNTHCSLPSMYSFKISYNTYIYHTH